MAVMGWFKRIAGVFLLAALLPYGAPSSAYGSFFNWGSCFRWRIVGVCKIVCVPHHGCHVWVWIKHWRPDEVAETINSPGDTIWGKSDSQFADLLFGALSGTSGLGFAPDLGGSLGTIAANLGDTLSSSVVLSMAGMNLDSLQGVVEGSANAAIASLTGAVAGEVQQALASALGSGAVADAIASAVTQAAVSAISGGDLKSAVLNGLQSGLSGAVLGGIKQGTVKAVTALPLGQGEIGSNAVIGAVKSQVQGSVANQVVALVNNAVTQSVASGVSGATADALSNAGVEASAEALEEASSAVSQVVASSLSEKIAGPISGSLSAPLGDAVVKSLTSQGTEAQALFSDLMEKAGAGGGGVRTATGANLNEKFFEAHVFGVPWGAMVKDNPFLAAWGCKGGGSGLLYASEKDPLWRSGQRDQEMDAQGSLVGVWGPLYPRQGRVFHASEIVASALDSYRAMELSAGTGGKEIQMGYPSKTSCMMPGENSES